MPSPEWHQTNADTGTSPCTQIPTEAPMHGIPQSKSLCFSCSRVTGEQTKILPAPAKWFTESYIKLCVPCLSGCAPKAMRKYWQLRAWSPWIILCLSPAINKCSLLCTSLSSADNRAPPPPFLKVHSNNFKIIYEHCSARACPLAQPVGDTRSHRRLPPALLIQTIPLPGTVYTWTPERGRAAASGDKAPQTCAVWWGGGAAAGDNFILKINWPNKESLNSF